MKKIIFIKLLVLLSVILYAQGADEEKNSIKVDSLSKFSEQEKNYPFVEDISPEFPGGEDMMHIFLHKNITYPKKEIEKRIQGTVWLRLLISEDGSINEIKVMNSPSEGLSKETIRVVKLMPNFIPGKIDGKIASIYYNLPVKFKLPN